MVIHGLDVPASCSIGEFALEICYAQFVNIPADAISVAKLKGEDILTHIHPSDLLIFDASGNVDFTGTCLNWWNNPDLYSSPVAEGTVDAVFTANNVAGPGVANPWASAFHMSAHGLLDSYDSNGAVSGKCC